MNKQKTLLPTLKEGHRYLVYEIKGSNIKFNNFEKIHSEIISNCNNFLGVFDGAKAGLMSAKYSVEKNRGVIRVNSAYVDKLKLCLGMIKKLENKDVIIDCIYASGMLHNSIDKMNS